MKSMDSLILTVTGENGKVLMEKKLTSIPLAEETILRLSVEFFGDPEPCMIHRSAVMSRMYMEMLEYFTAAQQSGTSDYLYAGLPQRISSFMDIAGCYKVTVKYIAHP